MKVPFLTALLLITIYTVVAVEADNSDHNIEFLESITYDFGK